MRKALQSFGTGGKLREKPALIVGKSQYRKFQFNPAAL
jgi:hypothetical protein